MQKELEYFVFKANLTDEHHNKLEETMVFCCNNVQWDNEIKHQLINNEWMIDKQSLVLILSTHDRNKARKIATEF